MLLGFLTKHALEITNRPEADEGFFVTFSQIGTILGSLLAGWWGNRNGGKVLLITSRIICIVVCCWASMVRVVSGLPRGIFHRRIRTLRGSSR